MNKIIILASIWFSALGFTCAQSRSLTLEQAIRMARSQSVDAAIADNKMQKAYWNFHTYRANRLPEVTFKGTLPSYNSEYTQYLQPDGSYTFLPINTMSMSGELSVKQQVGLTGGTLSINSSLNFNRTMTSASNTYMSIPFALTYTQPVLGVNHFRWQKKIEPVRYKEATLDFAQQMEDVTIKTITKFFDLVLARENLITTEQNLANANKIYEIAIARREMGKISESELMQLHLSALQAKANVTTATSSFNAKLVALKSFLGIDDNTPLEPELPCIFTHIPMYYETVLQKANTNNPFAQNILRRQLEADYEVASAKGAQRDINLYASIGFTGMNNKLHKSYSELTNNQIAEIGITIPILDWGKRRGKVKVAESNREVIKQQIRQEEMDFTQNIFLLVENYNNQASQLEIAIEADEIAQKRYNTAIETFLKGKINILDLNDAQNRKDNAKQKHIEELYRYWSYYYNIRSVTLYDFEQGRDIEHIYKDE